MTGKDKIKLLLKIMGIYFFVWSLPFITIILNVIQNKELFEITVLLAVLLGLVINLIWDFTLLALQKKEYHKYYL